MKVPLWQSTSKEKELPSGKLTLMSDFVVSYNLHGLRSIIISPVFLCGRVLSRETPPLVTNTSKIRISVARLKGSKFTVLFLK